MIVLKYLFICFMMLLPLGANAASSNKDAMSPQTTEIIEQFNQDVTIAPERAISTERKHQILFLMGGALLLLIFLAAGFGIAMGIFGKDVFIWHVLSAGLATTLAIAHGVVAFVWFYPK
ncbi:MAG: hypothetical protein COA61_006125 [Zetaproteobacteria bacterium]|nr:hypothetical protein [Zetaproteobacteria bacterium]